MRSLDLSKMLKRKALTNLLADLETLFVPGFTLGIYNAEGQWLTGSAKLSVGTFGALLKSGGWVERLERDWGALSFAKPGMPAWRHAVEKELSGATQLPVGAARKLLVSDEPAGFLVAVTPTSLLGAAPDGDAEDASPSAAHSASLQGLVYADGRCQEAPWFSSQLDAVANLLTHLFTQAVVNRALAKETLERYREINLLYRIQEVIGARLDLNQIANLVLEESIRVIKAQSGALLLLAADPLMFDVQARYGTPPLKEHCQRADTVADWVVQNRQPIIVNDVSTDPRCGSADMGVQSLLCVPLNIGKKPVGAFTLYDKVADEIFTASDQKLLTALASPAVIAIETAREVAARENRLKAKIRELRIEIDEIRKKSQVASITTTDYFARLQQSAQEMRREFEEDL